MIPAAQIPDPGDVAGGGLGPSMPNSAGEPPMEGSQRPEQPQDGQSTSPVSELAELNRRVAGLELEVTRLRPATAEAASTESVTASLAPLMPPYIAQAVVAVEGHLADMERFVATGNEIAAQQSRIAAAMRCCTALRRICDDDNFLEVLMSMRDLVSVPPAANLTPRVDANRRSGTQASFFSFGEVDDIITGGILRNSSFRELEVQILRIAGLPEILADAHVDAAIDAYRRNPVVAFERLQDPMVFLTSLRSLREASCLSADFLLESIRQQQTRQRYKKLVTFGLSGTLIVAANSVATALLGPIGVAASGAIGSAAVGVAAQFLA